MDYLLQGFLLGFLIAIPVGPIDLLCIRNSLLWGWVYGLSLGLGIAVADALSAAFVGLSLSVVATNAFSHAPLLQMGGALFLCGLGINSLYGTKITEKEAGALRPSFFGEMITGFVITFTNPSTFLSFVALFTAFQVKVHKATLPTLLVTLGVFLGSLLWWFILSVISSFFKKKFKLSYVKWLNLAIGIVFIGAGISIFSYTLSQWYS